MTSKQLDELKKSLIKNVTNREVMKFAFLSIFTHEHKIVGLYFSWCKHFVNFFTRF
jgi:hypothetical protein